MKWGGGAPSDRLFSKSIGIIPFGLMHSNHVFSFAGSGSPLSSLNRSSSTNKSTVAARRHLKRAATQVSRAALYKVLLSMFLFLGSAADTGGAAEARSFPQVPRRVWAGSAGLPLPRGADQETARGRGERRGGWEWWHCGQQGVSTLSCVCQMNGPTMSEIEIQKYKIGAIKELNLTNQI